LRSRRFSRGTAAAHFARVRAAGRLFEVVAIGGLMPLNLAKAPILGDVPVAVELGGQALPALSR